MGALRPIKVGILTSSRADFGIYLPLLRALKDDPLFDLSIIAFGTHLSKFHGYTVEEIEKQGFDVRYTISSMLVHDGPASISTAYALTAFKFADFWNSHGSSFDWIFCLGDRYEMAAAVAAGVPLGVRFAHIHGGETTLGAIDNVYRHFITLSSKLHFVAAEPYKRRIKELVGTDEDCIITGALSLDNLHDLSYLSEDEFRKKWGIDIRVPFLLVTVHPETVAFNKNEEFAYELHEALSLLIAHHNLLITMPNADTFGSVFRTTFQTLKRSHPQKIYLVENFGTQSYFTCMKFADFLIGNTSSGIIEAASFHKYVINLGNRQAGRLTSGNVIHVSFNCAEIIEAALSVQSKVYDGENIYKKGDAASLIKQTLIRKANAPL